MRPICSFRTASLENYKQFCEQKKEIKVTYSEYKKILYTYNSILLKYLIESGRILKLPYGFGPIVITKYKPAKIRIIDGEEKKNLPIDWKLTKETGTTIRTLNMHTDGNKYYFAWLYNSSKIKANYIWSFKVWREFSRLLAKKLKEDTFKYKDMYREWIKR